MLLCQWGLIEAWIGHKVHFRWLSCKGSSISTVVVLTRETEILERGGKKTWWIKKKSFPKRPLRQSKAKFACTLWSQGGQRGCRVQRRSRSLSAAVQRTSPNFWRLTRFLPHKSIFPLLSLIHSIKQVQTLSHTSFTVGYVLAHLEMHSSRLAHCHVSNCHAPYEVSVFFANKYFSTYILKRD